MMNDTISARSEPKPGPHSSIETANSKERFLAIFLDRLWEQYRSRIDYVSVYEEQVHAAGATFVNDHIAFRTLAGQNPPTGIFALSRIFIALGYQAVTCYHFEDKHLDAIHFQHPNSDFPKMFISELRTWELSTPSRKILAELFSSQRKPISLESLAALTQLDDLNEAECQSLLELVFNEFHERPWNTPAKEHITSLNTESQYAAWVAVHGFNVNHFTALINSHGVESLDTIEKTVSALRSAGVPMKSNIEGDPGSKLRQSATEATVIEVPVTENNMKATMPWTYAYFELAERGNITNPKTGLSSQFEGFLGPQATHLFEMTRRDENA